MSFYTFTTFGGHCPVQAEGRIIGDFWFYFRARGEHWSMTIYENEYDMNVMERHIWSVREPYGDGQFAAGWMEDDVAKSFIHESIKSFLIDYGLNVV